MIAEYSLITLFIIYVGLYYVSIKKVIKSNFTKKKKYILINIVMLIPIFGVFVPLFISVEDNSRNDYIVTASDKTEFFHEVTSNIDNSIDME